ncbi:hypothetical protein K432DRAFT_362278 [Lepidopterella palustris CBS 459.81]|uniref:Uncharacterized protein n=1 Tax=Lepidopterella palustris CBS 459.81 TaxID=1314670 RepID=A0A8E2E143_9PEZI|nr:hypothetical protein K432DRAFT_362278 [Lepidopterella palustris CBS 459.81]
MPSFLAKGCALILSLAFAITPTFAQDCVLTVPPNPLSATGLATPYILNGCNQIDFSNQGVFVEAAIFDPATSTITVYNPLVVNQGMKAGTDFIAPVPATVPAGATVGIWFGTNAATLTLAGSTQGCVNGLGNSIFGQFAHCNGDVFMKTAQAAVTAGKLQVPPPGTGTGGTCPTVRDFRVVDMDQSDNVDTTYLLIGGNKLAQNTPANAAANPTAEELTNGSDNALINDFLAPALGCTSFTVSSVTAPSGKTASLATNELQANSFPSTFGGGPALVPLNDDFAVINTNGVITQSLQKTNLYRAGVGQPQAANIAGASGTAYCKSYAISGIFIAQQQGLFTGKTSPAPAVANNLFTFMAQRFAASFGPVPALGCTTIFGIQNPVTLTTDAAGVVTAATINTAPLQSILAGQIKPTNTAAAATTATAAATSVSSAQATQVFGHGTGQVRHKGGNNSGFKFNQGNFTRKRIGRYHRRREGVVAVY